MFEDLTIQQFCALDHGRNMVVTAGPGAGKTKVFSHRFCFILLTDNTVTLPQILALTFTEKAAEEMKARIYEMMSRIERDAPPGLDEIIINRINRAKDDFYKNNISTIHAFCAKLLREHPVESGVDPGFVVIQGASQRRMMEQAVETGISHVWHDTMEELIPLLQAINGRRNLLLALQKMIAHPFTLDRVLYTKERLFHIKGWEKQVFKEYCRIIKEHHLIWYLKKLKTQNAEKGQYEEVISLLDNWSRNAENDAAYYGVPGLFRQLRALVLERKPLQSSLRIKDGLNGLSYSDFVEDFYPDLFIQQSPDLLFGKQLDLFLKIAVICNERYRKEKERVNGLDFADLESQSYTFLMKLHQDSNPDKIKRIQNRFRYIMIDEFQDTNRVQWEIIRLLCSDKDKKGNPSRLQTGKLFVVGDKRQAIYRFRGGDVTVFQSVIEEIKASNPGEPVPLFWQDHQMNRFVGGMDKGYLEFIERQAKTFDALQLSERKNIRNGDIYLPHNFRTDSRPIAFLNNTFEKIFSNKGLGTLERYETAPRLITMPDKAKRTSRQGGSVTIYLTRASITEGNKAESNATLLVDIIERLLGRQGKETFEYGIYSDIRERLKRGQSAIGILFFTFSRIKTFEGIFREAGLPFSVYHGKGFYRCPEVMEMLQLLNYLSDERATISLLSILRSPIFGMMDSDIFDLFYDRQVTLGHLLASHNPHMRKIGEQIQSWRILSNRLTVSELIRKVIMDRFLTAVYSVHPNGVQRLANIEKLMEIARRFQGEGNGSLLEFVQYCLQMAEEDEEEGEASIISETDSPICLMTVHAAKGLEFPMVIVPELDYRIPARPNPGKPVRLYPSSKPDPSSWNGEEGELPVWPIEVPELDYIKQKSPLCYLLMKRNRLEEMAEKKRVFYVACTRTKNHLVLLGNMNNRLMKKDKIPLSLEDYRERATIMDMLDDIHQFTTNFPPEKAQIFEGNGEAPSVIWRDLEPRRFKGVLYGEKRIDHDDFGTYTDNIKDIDLTQPIKAPSYLQLSFKSIHLFQQCPIRFYYRNILRLKANVPRDSCLIPNDKYLDDMDFDENPAMEYRSNGTVLIGSLIHKYLENHHFGNPFNEKLFRRIWESICHNYSDSIDVDEETLIRLKEKGLNQIQTTINDKQLLSLLEGQADDYREVPFLFQVAPGCDFRGFIDRLFREKRYGHWNIIDWKSNDLTTRDPLQVIQENDYHLQLACYGWAAETILNESVENRYIYFTNNGQLIRSQWDDHPKGIIDKILQKIRDYDTDWKHWVRWEKEKKQNAGDCGSCEFGDSFCRI